MSFPAFSLRAFTRVLLLFTAFRAPAAHGADRAEAAAAHATSSTTSPAVAWPLENAFPRPSAQNVCPDTPLRLVFAGLPALGSSGKIHIVDAATGKDADTIDVGVPVATKTIGGEPNYRYRPIIISDGEATLYPRNGALAYNTTYYVTADAGVFKIAGVPSAALERSSGWTFTTKRSGPTAGTTPLTVAADGTGDFCTVQAAIDFVPAGNTAPTTINIRRGLYTEIVFFTNKHALTLIGEDRRQTVIAYATNDRFNPTNGNPFGGNAPSPASARLGGNIYHRGVFLAHGVNDLVLANLTVRNTTPQGGSQAEAIILNGTPNARAILKDVDLYSYQDTLQINGQAYLSGCYIEGDVDFMWGTGPCFFDHCTCRALRSGAYYTQIRNPGTNHGYVYVDCTFDGAQGIMGNYLSRIGTGRFPHSEVVLIDCTLTTAVHPTGWQFQGGREGNERDPASVHFWEANSRNPGGEPVDVSFRLPGSKQLTAPTDATTIGDYRNPSYVLGGDWNPRATAIFSPSTPPSNAAAAEAGQPGLTPQPKNQLVLLGTTATLRATASAQGAAVSVQWYKNGHAIPHATNATLRIDRMTWDDAAVYTAIARDAAGHTSSASAPTTLTAIAPQASPAPVLPNIPAKTFEITSFGAVADGATDNTAAIQKTIAAAQAAGGGTVLVPAAAKPFLCGPIALASNIELEVATGATLRCLPYSPEPRPGAYPARAGSYAHFITVNGAHDVALTGGGTIDGDGEAWWAAYRQHRDMPTRPFLARFSKCERVLVAGLTFTRSPMFHVAINADHLTVFGVTIDTPDGTPNTDGIDPSGSHHLIQNCVVSCGDDNVVMKPGSAFCSDISVADCAFGEGHGLSVGGQSNRGLDGMTVKNCSFAGTTSALRLKADPTQGGEVKNISFSNLTMDHVMYPIVFYSYYNKVGNPAAIRGRDQTTPEKVRDWNATPPHDLPSRTMPSWKNLSVSNLVSGNTKGYSIIWGQPVDGYLIENVKLTNVRIAGSPGFEVYNAANVQFAGDSDVGKLIVANGLVVARQPQTQAIAAGGDATFTVAAEAGETPVRYQWTYNGEALADGTRGDGTVVAGATTATLTVQHASASAAGKYAVVVSASLDRYDPATKALVPASLPVKATTGAAVLTVAAVK